MLYFFRSRTATAKDDLLSGLTVSLALVPEAIAFAFVAGVSPIIGLYSAFIIGLVTSFFGGRPGMISGATGAMAVVIVGLVAIHGIEYLFPTVILCGVIQMIVGRTTPGQADSTGSPLGDAGLRQWAGHRDLRSPRSAAFAHSIRNLVS